MNDLSMIKIAGYGVAMGNAKQEVKKWAKYTTKDNNNNGIAHLLYKIMEKYSPYLGSFCFILILIFSGINPFTLPVARHIFVSAAP